MSTNTPREYYLFRVRMKEEEKKRDEFLSSPEAKAAVEEQYQYLLRIGWAWALLQADQPARFDYKEKYWTLKPRLEEEWGWVDTPPVKDPPKVVRRKKEKKNWAERLLGFLGRLLWGERPKKRKRKK